MRLLCSSERGCTALLHCTLCIKEQACLSSLYLATPFSAHCSDCPLHGWEAACLCMENGCAGREAHSFRTFQAGRLPGRTEAPSSMPCLQRIHAGRQWRTNCAGGEGERKGEAGLRRQGGGSGRQEGREVARRDRQWLYNV